MLRQAGYIAMSGQIVDASLVAAPRQRNTDDEKKAIKEGRIRRNGRPIRPSCGTPVIAFNRGSAPEVIEDGLTGFIVEDINGTGAVDRLSHLSRDKIRRRFEQRFTARRMAQDYLSVYRSMTDRIAPHLRLVSDDAPAAPNPRALTDPRREGSDHELWNNDASPDQNGCPAR
jgi:hypothetical protein